MCECFRVLRKGSSWARLPVLKRKCDSGDDRPLQPIRRRQTRAQQSSGRVEVDPRGCMVTGLIPAKYRLSNNSWRFCLPKHTSLHGKCRRKIWKRKQSMWILLSCNVCIWPAEGRRRPIIRPHTLVQTRRSRSYLTCGISEEVTDVRNNFTERQTLRSKPGKTEQKQTNLS